MEIALLFGLIVLNGVFAMSEIALMTARRVRLQKLSDAGDKAAQAALQLGEDPDKFLSTIQIGITSISILNGIVGEATLARPFALWLQSLGTEAVASQYMATGLVVVTITYFSIVLGELVPKRLGQINPEPLARLVARPMQLLAALAKPFVRLLSGSTQLVLRVLGVNARNTQAMTEEDLHMLLEEGSDAGIIEQHEHRMVRNVFRLDDRQIGSFMVPRGEVVFFDANDDLNTNLERFESSQHSRFPVLQGGWNTILGVMDAKQMLAQTLRREQLDFTAKLNPPVFVPESLTGMELLENFTSTGTQLAFIVDEYGEVQGIVTLQDVMEAITGEIKTTRPDDSWAVQREDGSWLLDGLIPTPELKDRLDIHEVPEEERGRYNTLSGMLLLLFGNIPHTGDRCTWANWEFEVLDLDGLRIDKVLATRLPAGHDSESSHAG
jgi:putative hemolysin